jgi:hypothetical protein
MKPDFIIIIRGRDALKAGIESFKRAHLRHCPPSGRTGWGVSWIVVRAAIEKLDPETCTLAELTAATKIPNGGGGWGALRCDACERQGGVGEAFDDMVRLGEPPGYESNTIEMCRDCFKVLQEVSL